MNALSQYIQLYQEYRKDIEAHSPALLNRYRPTALADLMQARFPEKGDEGYPALSVNKMFEPDYGVNINRVPFGVNAAESFRCGVPNISTLLALVVNDAFVPTAGLERNLPKGVEVMSLAKAAELLPDQVGKYYNTLALPRRGATAPAALNSLLVEDGVFVHVAKGVKLDKPLQIVNISNASAPFLAIRRLLIVLDEDAEASILLCDHSASQEVKYLNCQVAEVFLEPGAKLGYYEIEESSAHTSRHSQFFASQAERSTLILNGTSLIGGVAQNDYSVEHIGHHADTKLTGMVIADGEESVGNSTLVLHNHPQCHSDQSFKYILDDRSQGSFYGRIIVDEKAKFTKAYQSNRNILASADARMHTRPQLEIYCDEVKCSHGATVGQLDANALFYMRQRGIPEAEAKMMLMQAFMGDVIDTVEIPALRSRLHQLVEARLSGNRQLCADCQNC
ncbi:MAG: Fe-S cluster assembly protein SufD [Bacteroidales bacterium]|nr:Fe-S cluster assembly protein SufD [Bacteroidales bacterium]